MLTKPSKLRQNQVRLLFELSNWVSNLVQYLATVKNTFNTHRHIYRYVYVCLWVCEQMRWEKKKKKTKSAGAEICSLQSIAKGWVGKQNTFRTRLLNCGHNPIHKKHWDARWSICIFWYLIWSYHQAERHQLKYSEVVWNCKQKPIDSQ